MKKKPSRRDTFLPPGHKTSWNYPIEQILSLRGSLTEILRGEYEGKAPARADFDRLVDIVCEALPGDLHYETVRESCRHLAGVLLDADLIKATAWRLAGNLPRLRRQRPVPPWTVQRFNEWVPLHIESVDESRSPRGKFGANVTMQILAGTPCALRVTQWWSLGTSRYRAWQMGFSRRYPFKYPFRAAKDLVTFRLYGLIEPKWCRMGEPGFFHMSFPPSISAWNREQVKHTVRVDKGYECPFGHPREFACRTCPTGYRACRGGKHASDYVFKPCPVCQESDAPFDPDRVSAVCVNCRLEAVVLRKSQ